MAVSKGEDSDHHTFLPALPGSVTSYMMSTIVMVVRKGEDSDHHTFPLALLDPVTSSVASIAPIGEQR